MLKADRFDPDKYDRGSLGWQWMTINKMLNDSQLRQGMYCWLLLLLLLFGSLGYAASLTIAPVCRPVTPTEKSQ